MEPRTSPQCELSLLLLAMCSCCPHNFLLNPQERFFQNSLPAQGRIQSCSPHSQQTAAVAPTIFLSKSSGPCPSRPSSPKQNSLVPPHPSSHACAPFFQAPHVHHEQLLFISLPFTLCLSHGLVHIALGQKEPSLELTDHAITRPPSCSAPFQIFEKN